MTTFSHISLSHIYRDKNKVVDGLSKEALGLEQVLGPFPSLRMGIQMISLMHLGYKILYRQ
jgi:hypothetical protein